MEYDLIFVEDDKFIAEYIDEQAHSIGLNVMGTKSLQDLETVLQENSAKLFSVDGRFPRGDFGVEEYLAIEAIDMIREKYPSAPIILYSSDDRKGLEVAKSKDVRFVDKSDWKLKYKDVLVQAFSQPNL